MRIISKHYDYYDNVSYEEDGCIFVRKEDILNINPIIYLNDILKDEVTLKHYMDKCLIIGFCGRVYPFISFCREKDIGSETINCYTIGQVEKAIEMKGIDKQYKKDYYKKSKSCVYWWSKPFKKDQVEKFFSHSGEKISDDIFFELKTPIFITNIDDNITVNPILKDFNFQRMIDPYTAYQEIDMYIGGVLGSVEVDIVNISDECMKEAKGFDKWSFKTMPTKKRK